MHALVFADRPRHELLPLTESTPLPLLPVCGKTLIEHTIDDLVAANVRSIMIVLSEQGAAAIENTLGSGFRWGVKIEYARRHFGESASQVARRVATRLPSSFLALRGDVYRSPMIAAFRQAASNILASQVMATVGGRCAQLCMCRNKGELQLNFLSWVPEPLTAATNWQSVDLGDVNYFHLHDVPDFYLANLDGLDEYVAAANAENSLPGRPFYTHPYSRFRPQVVCAPPVLIGYRCEIAPDVQLNGPVVLGDDVHVDRGAFLYACVVLPGTYIPPGTELRNAVVTNEIAIGIDGNVIGRLDEWPTERSAIAN